MFNPAQFLAPRHPAGYLPSKVPQRPISIDPLPEVSRSRWDASLSLPSVLYSRFNVPMPPSEHTKQDKPYPPTLLDYIKRAYERCKDLPQRKTMEQELRKIIASFGDGLNQVDWKTYPLPFLMPVAPEPKPVERQVKPQLSQVRKGEVRLPSSYNIIDEGEEKPSKAKLMAQKRLEKLERKLNSEDQDQRQENKLFIGFHSRPEPSRSEPSTAKFHSQSKLAALPSNQTKKKSQTPSSKDKPAKEKHKKQQKQKKTKREQEKGHDKHSLEKEKKREPIRINRKELELISRSKEENERLGQVAKRFTEFNKIKTQNLQQDVVNEDIEAVRLDELIVGRSEKLEKPYLRITGRPNPDTVRPEHILKKALAHFLNRYKEGCSYEYLISEFKSLRQDLTVQHIKNGLTVQVYEENMRISLFEGDTAQFKHCQTTLWQLYCQGLYYTKKSRNEYIAYQMITLIMEGKFQDMGYMLTQVPPESLATPQVQDSLKIKRLLMVGNYRGFFDFMASRDIFTRRLLNLYIDKVRIKCLLMVCKTFGDKISMQSLADLLGEDEDVLEAIIREEKGVIDKGFLLLKPSYDIFINSEHLKTKKVTVLLG